MQFDPPLIPARLLRRYKRFLFDAVLDDGREITGSCPNTGSMLGLTDPGSRIWLSQHETGPTRKFRHRFELIEVGGVTVGVNSSMANRFAEEAIRNGMVTGLATFSALKREQKYGRQSRIDFLLSGPDQADTYVEVKNVHFSRVPGLAEFPDTATERGVRHLDELGDMVEAGHRAMMLYLIQREDCHSMAIANDLDPVYAAAFARARRRGVEVTAVNCRISPTEISPFAVVAMDEGCVTG